MFKSIQQVSQSAPVSASYKTELTVLDMVINKAGNFSACKLESGRGRRWLSSGTDNHHAEVKRKKAAGRRVT